MVVVCVVLAPAASGGVAIAATIGSDGDIVEPLPMRMREVVAGAAALRLTW